MKKFVIASVLLFIARAALAADPVVCKVLVPLGDQDRLLVEQTKGVDDIGVSILQVLSKKSTITIDHTLSKGEYKIEVSNQKGLVSLNLPRLEDKPPKPTQDLVLTLGALVDSKQAGIKETKASLSIDGKEVVKDTPVYLTSTCIAP